ncbi:MAG: hypothetical protein QM736_06115 [Vicinamibacterales bacterium]
MPYLNAHLGSAGRWFGQVGAVFTDPNSATQGGNGVPPFMIKPRRHADYTQWYAVGTYTAAGQQSRSSSSTSSTLPPARPTPDSGAYQEMRDPSVFNFYDQLLDGPNKTRARPISTPSTPTFRQTFLRDLVGFELAYDRQNSQPQNCSMFGFDAYTIFVDMQYKLVDGTPNRNFGRPYVASDSIGNNFVDTAPRSQARHRLRHRSTSRRRILAAPPRQARLHRRLHRTEKRTPSRRSYQRLLLHASTTTSTPTTPRRTTYPGYAAIHYLGRFDRRPAAPPPARTSHGITALHTPAATGTALLFDSRINQWVRAHVTTISAERARYQQALLRCLEKLQPHQEQSAIWQSYLFNRQARRPRRLAQDDLTLACRTRPPRFTSTGETDPYAARGACPRRHDLRQGPDRELERRRSRAATS